MRADVAITGNRLQLHFSKEEMCLKFPFVLNCAVHHEDLRGVGVGLDSRP
jgi:hypothetical protein